MNMVFSVILFEPTVCSTESMATLKLLPLANAVFAWGRTARIL